MFSGLNWTRAIANAGAGRLTLEITEHQRLIFEQLPSAHLSASRPSTAKLISISSLGKNKRIYRAINWIIYSKFLLSISCTHKASFLYSSYCSRSAQRRSGLSASTAPVMVPLCVSRLRRLRLASTLDTSAVSAASTP